MKRPQDLFLVAGLGLAAFLAAAVAFLSTSTLAIWCLVLLAVPLALKMGLWRVLLAVSFTAAVARSNAVTGPELGERSWYLLQFAPLIVAGTVTALLPHRRAPRSPRVLLLLLMLLAGASTTWSIKPTTSLAQAGAFFVCGTFLILSMPRWASRDVLAGDIMTIFGLAAVAQAIGLMGWSRGSAWALSDYGRYQGLLTNPNFAGLLSGVAIPSIFYLLGVNKGTATRVALLAAEAILLATLFLSGSRGALLAAVLGLLATMATRTQRARAARLLWAMCIMVLVAYLALPSSFAGIFEGFSRIQQRTDLSAGRLQIYAEVLQRWQEHPILGAGFRTAEDFGRGTVTAHNIYLGVLSELGAVGGLLFLTLIVTVWRSSARQGVERSLVGPAIAVLVIELTESTLFGFGAATPILSWLWLLCFAATGSVRTEALPVAENTMPGNTARLPTSLRGRPSPASALPVTGEHER